jgi:transposase
VSRVTDGAVQAVIETKETRVVASPDRGVFTSRVKDRPLVRVKDPPASGQRVALWWRKRRLVCAEELCNRRSLTETTTQIPPRSRLTARLGGHSRRGDREVKPGGGRGGRRVRGGPALRAHRSHAGGDRVAPEPAPTRVLGIDETRARSVRWLLEPAGWRRSDP